MLYNQWKNDNNTSVYRNISLYFFCYERVEMTANEREWETEWLRDGRRTVIIDTALGTDIQRVTYSSSFLVVWSSSRPGTAGFFAHSVLYFSDIPKSFVIIFQKLSFFMSWWLKIIQTVNQQIPHILCLTHSVLTSVPLVEGLPFLGSSSTSLRPTLNLLLHSKTHVIDIVLFSYTCWSISRGWDRFVRKQTKNFRFIHVIVFIVQASVLIAEQPGKKRKYKQTHVKKCSMVAES